MNSRRNLNFYNPDQNPIESELNMANMGAGYDKAAIVTLRKTEYGTAGGTLDVVDNQGRANSIPVITSTLVTTRGLSSSMGGF